MDRKPKHGVHDFVFGLFFSFLKRRLRIHLIHEVPFRFMAFDKFCRPKLRSEEESKKKDKDEHLNRGRNG